MVLLFVSPVCIPRGIYIRRLRKKRDADMGFQGYYSRISNDNGALDIQFLSIDEDIDMQENEMEFGNKVVHEGSVGEGGFAITYSQEFGCFCFIPTLPQAKSITSLKF